MLEGSRPKYLPPIEYVNLIRDSDFDLAPTQTLLQQASVMTTFGYNLAKAADFVTSNTQVVEIVFNELTPLTNANDFERRNLPVRNEIAKKVAADTGYKFSSGIVTPGSLESLLEFMTAEEAEIRRKTMPERFPPNIYTTGWAGEDEIVIVRRTHYLIEEILQIGHNFQPSSYEFSIYKAGELRSGICFTTVIDYNDQAHTAVRYAVVSDRPFSHSVYTDNIYANPPKESIYFNPHSPYLRAQGG